MKDSEREPTILECILFGLFSLVPLLGFLVAVIALILGMIKIKVGGWKLVLIGVVGILLSNFSKASIEIKSSLHDIHRCVTAVEFYKQVHGQYPGDLKDLNEGRQGFENDPILIRDYSRGVGWFGKRQPYYYERLQDGTGYYLFGVGRDQKPFTSDDVYPNLTADEISHSGFKKKNPLNVPPM